MLAINYSTMRNNLKNYCDEATDNNEIVIVTRKQEKNIVLLSLENYNRLMKAAQKAEYLVMNNQESECNNMKNNGLSEDNSYLECGLPDFLQRSVEHMKLAWEKLDKGEEYLHWDSDFCELQSDINSAEVNQIISMEQAWYLREKYLRIERCC